MYGYNTFHDKILNTLIDSVRKGDNAHAYIFEGDSGLNVNESAYLFANAIVCDNQNSAPCTTCNSCITAKARNNPDIIYVNKGDKKSVGTKVLSDIASDTIIRPFLSSKKVYIIEDGDVLTESAQNAFLKTLEEPPSYAVFIIIVSNSSTLLQTILSRCVLIHFPPLCDDFVKKYILDNHPEQSDKVDFLVKYSDGYPGNVEKIINDDNFYNLRDLTLKIIPSILSVHKISSFNVVNFFSENKDHAKQIVDILISFLRDILVISLGGSNIINVDKMNILCKMASVYSKNIIVKAIDELIKTAEMLRRYVNLKATIMRLCLIIKLQ